MASFKAKFPVLQEIFAKNHRGAFGPLGRGLKDMQQLSSTCDSERMCVLATLTLGGSAGTFVARTLKENPRISWEELIKLIKTRYSELTDPFMAKEKCRRMQQRSGESVQNFAESLNTAALDAYDDIRLPHVCTRNHSGHFSERRKRRPFGP